MKSSSLAVGSLLAGMGSLALWHPCAAAGAAQSPPTEERWSLHFHLTAATQYHPSFTAAYSGANSMRPGAEAETAFVSGVDLDVRPWPGAELVFDPEMSGGYGLSRSLGVAAYPSGIVYRVGDPAPAIYLARLELRQTFDLGGGPVLVQPGANQLAGPHDRDTLTLSVGRLAVEDVVDGNAYAHDPATQFFDWALFASGAYDYPADTRGYTWGALGDLSVDWWSLRGGIALEPLSANAEQMDWALTKSRGLVAESEARYRPFGRRGAARVLVFLNQARMGSYAQVLSDPAAYGGQVQATRAGGRTKYGLAISIDQRLSDGLGAFLRASYDDGANETWAFTEIDRCVALGVVEDGSLFGWRDYEAGGAVVVSGLSPLHERYLAQGGYGFILGDGKLDYAPEIEGDFYLRLQLTDRVQLSGIYQPVIDPAYNRDRGPIHIFTGRLTVAF